MFIEEPFPRGGMTCHIKAACESPCLGCFCTMRFKKPNSEINLFLFFFLSKETEGNESKKAACEYF